ncbi:MAG TPA: hypothetical protein VM639_00820 [Dongiaceae bacterium]|nr:hypothetical protein [Dongiaceae bacterium]
MTVLNNGSRAELTGNGAQIAFTYPFEIINASDLVVFVSGSMMTMGTDYTVSGAGSNTGGTVTFNVAPANLAPIVFTRTTSQARATNYAQQGTISSDLINADFDRLSLVSQEITTKLSRTFGLADSVSGVTSTAIPQGQANMILGWAPDGSQLINVTRLDAGGVMQATTSRVGITRYATTAEAVAGSAIQAAVTPDGLAAAIAAVPQTESFIVNVTNNAANVTSGTGKYTFRMPYNFTLTSVKASLNTAQTSGSLLTVDVKKSGTSIFGTKITIDNTEKTSLTAATPPVLSTTSLSADDEISFDVPLLGDGTAIGLKVELIGHQ